MLDQRTYVLNRVHSYESLITFPSYFEIETVNACNARCPMCTIEDWDRRDGLMSDELFAKIADEIGEHRDHVKRVALYRDGEPLIDKKLAQKVRLLKERGVQKVGISTNVSLLTPDKSTALLQAGIDEVLLSIDSLKPAVYEAIRARLKYDEVMFNAQRFIEIRDALKSKCRIWVRMVRQELNKDEWPEYRDFWRARVRATDRVDYHNIHNWGGQLVGFKQIAAADTEQPCPALWSLMVIFANGDVPLCNVDYGNKYPVGNVGESSISEVWQSKEQNRRRQLHLDGKRSEIPMCISCNVWSEKQTSKQTDALMVVN